MKNPHCRINYVVLPFASVVAMSDILLVQRLVEFKISKKISIEKHINIIEKKTQHVFMLYFPFVLFITFLFTFCSDRT